MKKSLSLHSFKVNYAKKKFQIRLFTSAPMDTFHWFYMQIGRRFICLSSDIPTFHIYLPLRFAYTDAAFPYTIRELKEERGADLSWLVRNTDRWFLSKKRCEKKMKTLPRERFLTYL